MQASSAEPEVKQTDGDFSLFFYRVGQRLAGISGTYVDDILRAGDDKFKEKSTKLTHETFDAKELKFNQFSFTGLQFTGDKTQRRISQENYIARLQYLRKDASFEDFRSMRHKLA